LHQRRQRTGFVVVEEFFGDQECPAGGQVKHRALKLGVTRAGGQRQVAGATTQVLL
jgi:hypothetical protein